jgi:DNA polymerase I
MDLQRFREIWYVDTEFQAVDGTRVRPICLVAFESRRSTLVRVWLWSSGDVACPWDPDDPQTLVVAWSATAECQVIAVLGWRQPTNLIDLWAEYRVLTNGVCDEIEET